ncbi:MAG TPA: glutamate--tRNA ligase, partial [Gaiellales bacterium]
MPALRVRFCPSPTGLLHVGGVRTALYNWLYARRRNGVLVLRIEDTDEARENPEAIEQIQRSLRWCGLDWDEGPGIGGPHAPYLQSERRPLHLAVVEQMLADGAAYRCYCTPDELEAERREAQAAGRPTVYSRKCRGLDADARAALEAEGRRAAIRLAIPDEGEVVIDDLVRGEIRFENALLGDHVIVRSDGVPTYNLVNPLDDAAMGITHVIRGDDLLPSTPRQVHVYNAIGAEIPRFAHLSMILGPNRQRLSKRDGAASVEQLRDAGYLPEAVVNYLALLGWSLDGERELFTLDELA